MSAVFVQALIPDTGMTLVAAQAFLILGDSTRALQLTRRWLDSLLTYSSLVSGPSAGTFVLQLTPRAILMRADLAAGLGIKDEGRLWYDRFLSLWSEAEPEFRPLVERVRKSRAALGSS